MKIAQIVSTFPPYRGGMGNSAYNIAGALADLGHEVTVFTPGYNYQYNENELAGWPEKFAVIRLKPLFKYGNAAILPQLFWRLRDFDIAHLHYPFYGVLIIILLKKLLAGRKMKLALHYHMDTMERGLKGGFFYLYKLCILPLAVRSADIITCASLDYIKHSDLSKYYLQKPDKFKEISLGISLEQFVIYHDNLNRERDNNIILFVGGLDRAHYFKGLENLLKALAEIRQDRKFAFTILNVIGRGELLDYYKNCAKVYGLDKSVFFYEEADNSKLVDYYNYSDCLVMPSINQSEAFGLVLLEAMACSRPVIASDLPGVRTVFKNGREGLLVKPNNVKDLAEKLKIILGNKKSAQSMGRAGRELVEKKYSWSKVGQRLDSIYENMLNQ